jgi:hypothetical protein
MKIDIPIVLFFIPIFMSAQKSGVKDTQSIKGVINQFFESLEKKDSTLMLEVVMREGQVWRIYNDKLESNLDVRPFAEDVSSLKTIPDVREVALDFEIRIDNKIAMAWVPYEFYVEDTFSHCGIDVFTLFRVEGNWKIATAAYSVQKIGCKD